MQSDDDQPIVILTPAQAKQGFAEQFPGCRIIISELLPLNEPRNVEMERIRKAIRHARIAVRKAEL